MPSALNLGRGISGMLYHEQSEDYRPLFWMGGRPFYVNTVILAFHIIAFAAVALATGIVGPQVPSMLTLGNYQAVHGQVWRLFTYIIFPPYPQTAITMIFALGFLFYFGRGVEEHVGRKTYIKLLRCSCYHSFHSVLSSRLRGLVAGRLHGRIWQHLRGVYRLCDALSRRGNQYLVREPDRKGLGLCLTGRPHSGQFRLQSIGSVSALFGVTPPSGISACA